MKQPALAITLLALGLRTVCQADSVVVFNEIQYHPVTNEAANEWVELHNQMAVEIDLSAWFLAGAIDYTFPEGTIMPGGGYLIIASDPTALLAATGMTNLVGPFAGRLNNNIAQLRLYDRNARLMDEVEYRDGGKWPAAPDGSGATLAKRDPNSASAPPENWTSSVALGGTPGRPNFPESAVARHHTLVPFESLWHFNVSGTDLGEAWRAVDFDDSTWGGRNDATLVSYWPFDGAAAAVVGQSGTLVGAVGAVADRNGVGGGALAFNGLSQYVQVPGGGGLNGAVAGTISLWVRWTGAQDADCCGSFGAVLARQANGQFSDTILALNTADPAAARVVWRQSGGPAPVLITGTTIVGTNWHHIAITFSSGGTTLYLDGAPEGTAVGAGMNNNAGTPLSIGAWAGDGAGFASASIDDVAIWNRPLSALQVIQLAAQSKTPPDFGAPENAVYFAGDGRLATHDHLRHTALPWGATTCYFRTSFQFSDELARTQLILDLAVDDGAVFYLNGAEVYRRNMLDGPVGFSTLAATAVADAPLEHGISLPTTNLVQGANILAVEVHQASAGDAGMVFGAGLSALVAPPPAVEERTLIALHDLWKFDSSPAEPGGAWRLPDFADATWPSGPALLFAGVAGVDGVPPERIADITAVASTQYTADGRLAMNAVNGMGLIGNAHGMTPGGAMWLNNGTFVQPNDLDPWITFDLGAVWPVRSMKVWNYNEYLPGQPGLLARGVSRADVLVGATVGLLTNFVTGQSFNQAPGTATDFSQTIDLGGLAARYVRLQKLTNFPGGDNRFVGLSEVQFFRDVDLRRTELAFGPVTYYFRRTFNFAADPAAAELVVNAVVDDGAVFYLNGVEVYRLNMPADEVTPFTLASHPVPAATFTGPLVLPTASLVRGTNVLAVEVHQSATEGDPDLIFGAELTARITPPGPAAFVSGDLVLNEVTGTNASPFGVELVNLGTMVLDVGGYVLRHAGAGTDHEFVLGAQTLGPGELLVLEEAALGFRAAAGDKLFLFRPGRQAIADAVVVPAEGCARALEGWGDWLVPATSHLGATNTFALRDEIVFSEIMYHAPPTLETPVVLGTNLFVTLTNLWRYEQSGTDLGASWSMPDYDDLGWPAGPALLYATTSTLPAPKNTPLTLGPNTFYFRTSFLYTGAPTVLSLSLRHVVDDGAVFYLNGNEIVRFLMPTGAIRYTNFSSSAVGNAALRAPVAVPLTNLVVGTNVLAVEVHQAANPGNDVAFGAELSAVVEVAPHVPFSESTEQWVELFNRSTNAVDLTGWRLDEGIDFRFANQTLLPPGGYLVVAKDPAGLQAKYPDIAIVGPYTNSLSRRGERLVLKDSADNPADCVHYFDGGRWPGAADAGGSSLELRSAFADRSSPEAWAASLEGGKSEWRTYSYRGVAQASAVGPDGQWREFVMGLLEAGEVLLDDLSVIETPSTAPVQLIQNGSFDTGTNKWRIIGNHHGTVIDDPDQPGNQVLRLVATGETEHMSNHAETTLANSRDIVNGREYLISFRAKWISGSRQFHTRLYFNRLPRTTLLDAPGLHGTPGAPNSTAVANLGPTCRELRHDPPVPASFAPVPVFVQATDSDGLAALALHWSVDGGGWQSVAMTPTGSRFVSPPSRAVYDEFTASLPGQPAGTVVQFYVEAADALGVQSMFPADGPASRALYKVDDGLAATNGLHNIRLIALTADGNWLHDTLNLMSNERVGCTVVYDEREVWYDCGLHLKGSEHSRTTSPRLGFNVAFPAERPFRGVYRSVAIDRSESTGFGQREMLIHQTANHAGGLPTKYHDLIQVIAPRLEHTSSAELQLARYTDVFLDAQFDHGSDGTVFEYELIYQLNSTDTGAPEGNKVPAPDSVLGTNLRYLGSDKEAYRWNFLIKNNAPRDDFSRFVAFCQALELTGTNYAAQITNVLIPDQWLRASALCALSGAGDNYGGDGAQHNVRFYVWPGDGRVRFFPHDLDAFFDAGRPLVPNAELSKLISVPAYARAYYGHVLEIIATTYNRAYLTRWANRYGELLPAQDFAGHLAFIVQRANYLTGLVNSAVPAVAFAITSNGGNNLTTSNSILSLTGSAPLGVKTIEVNGLSYPITWTTTTAWSLRLPLYVGQNTLSVQGLDLNGRRLTNALDTITVTNTGPGALLPVVINEWMADNAAPGGFVDPLDGLCQDWFELYNPGTNAVNLSGFFLTDDLAHPTKWQIPPGAVLAPQSFRLVWADNQTNQNLLSAGGDLHAGFQLDNAGEAIGLFGPDGVAQHIVLFGLQLQNVSQGLFPDGDTNAFYFMTNWTPRAANQLGAPPPPDLTSIAIDADGLVTMSFRTVPHRTYRLESADDLNAPVWTPVGGNATSSGDRLTLTDTMSYGPQRFYRTVQLP
jgi:hypothetical protein